MDKIKQGAADILIRSRALFWLLPAIGILVYANGLSGPFIYDDIPAIVDNGDIRQLWPLWQPSAISDRASINHRPVVRLSLALNYALGGLQVGGYHLFNLAVHLCCALLLASLVRRTLNVVVLRPHFVGTADGLALACALLWMVHPLHSQCINYITQRTELLMALFYLLTLYCAVRAFADEAARGWQVAAVAACLAGMASKEVMVTAPLLVLLYDRIFVAGSFIRIWDRRRSLYAGLMATWSLLVVLLWSVPHGDSIGFASKVTPWVYAQHQCLMIVRYLGLMLWPDPLVLDYGYPLRFPLLYVAPYAAVVLGLVAATVITLRSRPMFGFLGAWFFLILAPTSSFIPLAGEVGAERRVYLPAAGAIVLLTITGYIALQWLARRHSGNSARASRWGVALVAVLVVGLGVRTAVRNHDYRSELSIWQAALQAIPLNPRAHNSLGAALASLGRVDEAIPYYQRALELYPLYPEAHYNLGNALKDMGQPEQAIDHYRQVIKNRAGFYFAHNNLGLVLQDLDRPQEAILHFRRALEIRPNFLEGHNNLAIAYHRLGRLAEAVDHFRRTIELRPDYAKGHSNLGLALRAQGDVAGGVRHLRRSLELQPDLVEAHYNLGLALRAQGDMEGAIHHLRRSLQIRPDFARARVDLETLERLRE